VSTPAPTLQLRVVRKAPLADGICGFELADPAGAPLPPFTAGAHLDVHLPGGLLRQYSLCNDPTETHRYQLGVLREPASRGGSVAMHDHVHEGDLIGVSEPKNHFPLAADAPCSLLMAGGIGITPILAMAEQLARDGAAFELHYAARTAARAAFAERLRAAPYAPRVHLHLDDGPAPQRLDIAALLAAQPAGTHLYVCGPKGYMDAVLGIARTAGWPEPQLHFEFFSGAEVVHADTDEGFDVRLARSGRVVRIGKDVSVVQALAAAGVDVPTSCEQGVCGTCLTRVLDGVPEHRDLYLTPEEQAANDQFTPCCSRAKTPLLVLDL
jgi:vanillate monooxygenase ferredoxin subunit